MSDTTTQRGLLLPCPCCHELSATVSISLANGDFFCAECEETFDASAVREMMEAAQKWARVLAWAEQLPSE